jgi:hypothetical protein
MTTTAIEYADSPRRPGSPFGRYVAGSLGLMAIASANGVLRDLTYAKTLGDETAHWISLVPMVGLFAVYVDQLERRWPLDSWRDAAAVGGAWTAIAVGFEVGVGHYVDGKSFSELLGEYDVSAGRPGAVVLLAAAAMPATVRMWRLRRSRRSATLADEAAR